jgi:cobalt-zinc-cadmium resistance protein CzcA
LSAKSLPDITLGYFNQSLIGNQNINGQEVYFGGSKRFQGVQLGLAIPLFYGSYRSKLKAAVINQQINEANAKLFENKLVGVYHQAEQEYAKNKQTLLYYQTSALLNATLILKNSQLAYQGGDMSYAEYLLNLKKVNSIRENYLMAILKLNQSINTLAFLNGNQ